MWIVYVCVCVCVCLLRANVLREHELLQVTMIECGGGTSSRPFFAPPLLLLFLIHRVPPAVAIFASQTAGWQGGVDRKAEMAETTWDRRMLKHITHFDIHCFLVSPPSSSYSAASLSHLRRLPRISLSVSSSGQPCDCFLHAEDSWSRPSTLSPKHFR
jgi:hypothetical protein